MWCGRFKVTKFVPWSPPPLDVLKFNVDGAARGKPGLAELVRSFEIVRERFYLCFPSMQGFMILIKEMY